MNNMYLVSFYNNGVKICTCWENGKDADEAMEKASFALMCKYSNVDFNEVRVLN